MVVVYDDAFQSKIVNALLMCTIVIRIGGIAGHTTTEVLCHFLTRSPIRIRKAQCGIIGVVGAEVAAGMIIIEVLQVPSHSGQLRYQSYHVIF